MLREPCCNQGARCTPNSGCIPQDADDCGGGRWCARGTQCWRATANVGSIRRGELECVTADQAAELEQAIAAQREEERQKRLAAEEAKRKAEQAKRDEKQRAELRRQQEQDAASRRQADEQLRRASEQQRQAELQRAARLRDEELRRRAVPQESCDLRKIQAIANGQDPNKVLCSNPTGQGGRACSHRRRNSRRRNKAWADQLDYLRRNAVRLQPEERRIAASPSVTLPTDPRVCSTFPGGQGQSVEQGWTSAATDRCGGGGSTSAATASGQRISTKLKRRGACKRKLREKPREPNNEEPSRRRRRSTIRRWTRTTSIAKVLT